MIAIVDYDAGNVGSVQNALTRLGVESKLTNSAEEILSADAVIFPGQGRAGPAMKSLKKAGLVDVIKKVKAPFLGICLGMQLLVDSLEEDDTKGLGIISGQCVKFKTTLPVPHMGWNTLQSDKQSINGAYAYFVHSYSVELSEYSLATTDYDGKFSSIIRKDNFIGVQFHPEKSAEFGAEFLNSFVEGTF